jgi:hypothetical protein
MMARGESVGLVLWVIKEGDFSAMTDLLQFYRRYLGPLPSMEIWSTRGVRLGSLESLNRLQELRQMPRWD